MQMETILSTPEIVLHPPAKEVFQLTMQSVRDCIESTKHFVRWMNGKIVVLVIFLIFCSRMLLHAVLFELQYFNSGSYDRSLSGQ